MITLEWISLEKIWTDLFPNFDLNSTTTVTVLALTNPLNKETKSINVGRTFKKKKVNALKQQMSGEGFSPDFRSSPHYQFIFDLMFAV